MGQSHQDLVGKLISLEDFKIQDRDPDALPKQWKDAAKSERPSEFRILLYHPEDTSFYLELDSKYGAFKDSTAAELGCSENGTWIDADALKDPEKILTRLKEHAQEKKEKEEQMAAAKRAEEIAARKLAEKELNEEKYQQANSEKEKNTMETSQVTQVGVRVVAEKLTDLTRNTIVNMFRQSWLSKNDLAGAKKLNKEAKLKLDSYMQGIDELLRSEFGRAAISYALGYLLKEGKPKLAKYFTLPASADVAVEILANEFQVAGLAAGTSSAIDKLFEVAAPQAGNLFSKISPGIKQSEFEQLAKDSAAIIEGMNLDGKIAQAKAQSDLQVSSPSNNLRTAN